jgi:hypothetical protein
VHCFGGDVPIQCVFNTFLQVVQIGRSYCRDVDGSGKEEYFWRVVLLEVRTVVSPTREGVQVVARSSFVKDLKVKSSEERGPSCLPSIERLGFGKVDEVFVIAEYIHRVLSPFQIVTPCFERLEDGEEFLVVDVVVALRRIHCF